MQNESMSVCVVGLGYIGLPTAALIASRGLQVTGVDIEPSVVETVAQGRVHIAEADLDGLVQKVVMSGALQAREAPERADVFIVAVPTPLSRYRKPVTDHVFAAARSIAPCLARGNLIIVESTCPVGTTEQISEQLAALRPDLSFPHEAGDAADIAVAYCPERVLPGRILTELVQNDRCVGGISPNCSGRACRFYELFIRGECFPTTARTAELVKLSENAFRDANIAFANELSMICERVGVDVWDVVEIANRHPRVNILKPGPGVGGHCIAVDPWFIVDAAPREAQLIRAARNINDHKTHHVFQRASALLRDYPDLPAACLGLTFKANVDDLRESPALRVAQKLADAFGDRIGIVEPLLPGLPATLAQAGARKLELEKALAQPGILIVLVDHDVFRRVPPEQWSRHLVYDTRGIWRGASGVAVPDGGTGKRRTFAKDGSRHVGAATLHNGRLQ